MRALLFLFVCLLSLSRAEAQVIAIHFNSDKATKKYKDHLVEYIGEMVVIGEIKSGASYSPETGTKYDRNGTLTLFVLDPKKPEVHAYYLVDGEKEEASKKNRLTIPGSQLRGITVVMRDQTLPGLSREYQLKQEELQAYRDARDSFAKASNDWLIAHHRLVTALEKFEGWLASVGFTGVIKGVQKTIKKEKKSVKKAALRERSRLAMESIQACEVPEKLSSISEKEFGGKHVFRALESQHFRMYYLAEGNEADFACVSDDEAERSIQLAEKILDGFRSEFIDPYVSEGFKDQLPDGLFATWLLVPNSGKAFDLYGSELLGYVRRRGAKEGDSTGTRFWKGDPLSLRSIWRLNGLDLRGNICHELGHALAECHYGGNSGNMRQAWLEEAVGTQISYQYTGRNNVTCLGIQEKPTYLKRKIDKPGKKVLVVGRRAVYNEMALTQGSPIQSIALKSLYQLNDADLAKGWSFYDFIARKEGRQGQEWLRAAGEFSTNPKSFVEEWRNAGARIFAVSKSKAFSDVEGRWREYAEGEQRGSEK
jgi:hypothetical protein